MILMKNNIILYVVLLVILTSCAKIYYPEKNQRIIATHKTIAFLPINFDIKSDLNNQQPQMDIYPVNYVHGLAFRDKLVRRISDKDISVKIIDLEYIDNFFASEIESGKIDFSLKDISEYSYELNADAVFIYCLRTYSAESQIEELKKDFLFTLKTGVYNLKPTTELKLIAQIYDGKTGEMIWQFNHWNKGMYFTNPAFILKPLIREICNNFPYVQDK
jgi:hypothetical protein